MKKKNIFLKIFDHIEEGILTVTFTVMTVVCFIQVITRYWFHYSIPWSEELLRALFVWSSCLGISLGFKTRSHLGVDAFTNVLPVKIRRGIIFFAYIVAILFCVVLIYYSVEITQKQFKTNQSTIAMRMPIFYISMSLPIGFSLTILRIVQVIKEDFFNNKGKTQEEDELHISEGLL